MSQNLRMLFGCLSACFSALAIYMVPDSPAWAALMTFIIVFAIVCSTVVIHGVIWGNRSKRVSQE